MTKSQQVNYANLLRQNGGLLAITFLAVFTGNLGQSFFIGLFQADISEQLQISTTQFGSIYSIITLISGFLVMHFGAKIDWISPRSYALAILLSLLLGLLLLTTSNGWIYALLGLALVRVCGQGMMTHFGNTVAGREFNQNRGRALGINALAMPSGEVILPPLTGMLLIWLSWQQVWWVITLILIALWVVLFLKVDWPQSPHKHAKAAKQASNNFKPSRDKQFWLLIPMLIVLPSTLTGIFVYQSQLTQHLNASPSSYILALTAMGIIRFPIALLGGRWIDDIGVSKIARSYLAPYAIALLLSALLSGDSAIWILMIGAGISMSMSSTVADSLLVELWGKERLGRVRALRAALLVFSTGIAPALFGFLLDADISFRTLLLGMLCYLAIAWLMAQSPINRVNQGS